MMLQKMQQITEKNQLLFEIVLPGLGLRLNNERDWRDSDNVDITFFSDAYNCNNISELHGDLSVNSDP